MTVRMDSKERCVAVFKGEVPDRAPVCDFGNSAMLSYTGHTVRECREDPTLITEIMRRWVADTGADLFFGPLETKGIFMDLPGVEIKLPENEPGSLKNAYYNSPEDVDSKPLYDPFDEKDSPMFHRYVSEALAAVGRGCEGAMAPAWCEGPLTVASYLRGAESLLMDMLMAPDEAKRVIAKGAALCRDIVSAELESFDADYVVCTDPVSSASMIDDSMFREYNMGNLISIVSHLKNRYDAPTMVHICGRRYAQRAGETTEIRVYSNQPAVTLFPTSRIAAMPTTTARKSPHLSGRMPSLAENSPFGGNKPRTTSRKTATRNIESKFIPFH